MSKRQTLRAVLDCRYLVRLTIHALTEVLRVAAHLSSRGGGHRYKSDGGNDGLHHRRSSTVVTSSCPVVTSSSSIVTTLNPAKTGCQYDKCCMGRSASAGAKTGIEVGVRILAITIAARIGIFFCRRRRHSMRPLLVRRRILA